MSTISLENLSITLIEAATPQKPGDILRGHDAEDPPLTVDHGKLEVTEACDYAELTRTFTTGEATVKLRFILDTVIGGPYDEGHVTYDDCSLARVE